MIELSWCKKFKEIVKSNGDNDSQTIYDFLTYCDAEEERIEKSFEVKHDGSS